jgi:hypothetical protein
VQLPSEREETQLPLQQSLPNLKFAMLNEQFAMILHGRKLNPFPSTALRARAVLEIGF